MLHERSFTVVLSRPQHMGTTVKLWISVSGQLRSDIDFGRNPRAATRSPSLWRIGQGMMTPFPNDIGLVKTPMGNGVEDF